MGFFRDLFGKRQPCELCHLGADRWSASNSGSADWKLGGPGGKVSLLVCIPCRQYLIDSGLLHKHPMLVLAHLVNGGRARRPSSSDFLASDSWRYIWVELLSDAGQYTPEPSQLAARIEAFADQFYTSVLEAWASDDGEEQESTDPYVAAIVEASGLLEPMIDMRTGYAVPGPTVRRCALSMVTQFSRAQLARPTIDAQMLFLGGMQEFEAQWRAWEASGHDPIEALRSAFSDDAAGTIDRS